MAVTGSVKSPTSTTARSGLGRLYWRVAEGLPVGWRPRFARFATSVAHGRRAVRRVRRRLGRRLYAWVRPALRRRAGATVVQWVARRFPPVRLPGVGPVWLLDARGVPASDVAAAVVAHRRTPGAARVVALVDDPRVDALRTAGIVYEYVPATIDDVSLAERRELLTWSYGVEREVLFTQW
jgi:hypothetical protein